MSSIERDFFYRIEDLSLTSGSKRAGFRLVISGKTAVRLSKIHPQPHHVRRLSEMVSKALGESGLLRKSLQKECGVVFHQGSAMPLSITLGCMSGSIGADGQALSDLSSDSSERWSHRQLELYPHNVDGPKQAMALLVMAHTWAEWAHALMIFCEQQAEPAASIA